MDTLQFCGMDVIESELAIRQVPVRERKTRRPVLTEREIRYHKRIQKKWNKRFGVKTLPAMFIMDREAAGLGCGQAIIIHPLLVPKLKAQLEADARLANKPPSGPLA